MDGKIYILQSGGEGRGCQVSQFQDSNTTSTSVLTSQKEEKENFLNEFVRRLKSYNTHVSIVDVIYVQVIL
jgi:hypothetical protein